MPDRNRPVVGSNVKLGNGGGHHCPAPGCKRPGQSVRCLDAQHIGYCPVCMACVQWVGGCGKHEKKKDQLLRRPATIAPPPAQAVKPATPTTEQKKQKGPTKKLRN